MTLPDTYFSESEQRPIPIRDREQMPDRRLEATINKVAQGDDTLTLTALRQERTRREAIGDYDPAYRGRTQSAALPRAAAIGDNNGPTEEEAFIQRLEEDHAKLLGEAAELELKASKLPKTVQSDEDVATISEWVLQAGRISRRAENTRKDAKEPHLRRGQWVDGFFKGIASNLESRIKGVEGRKAPFLKAKRDAEEAARNLQLAEERRRREEAEAAAKAEREERDRQHERVRLVRGPAHDRLLRGVVVRENDPGAGQERSAKGT